MSKLCEPLNEDQLKEYNQNIVSDKFLELCKDAGELFKRKEKEKNNEEE